MNSNITITDGVVTKTLTQAVVDNMLTFIANNNLNCDVPTLIEKRMGKLSDAVSAKAAQDVKQQNIETIVSALNNNPTLAKSLAQSLGQ